MRRRGKTYRTLLEFPVILLVSFVLVFGFVRPVIAAPFYVGSESMVPTLKVWDRVLINKVAYDFTGPNRGDIVLFESPASAKDPLIKRVVGLPGETVELRDGTLYVNGEPQEEPYLRKHRPDGRPYGPQRVPEGHVFVMGDNRANSFDSRFFGPVPQENLIGESLVRFWPPTRAGVP
ncbi:MAG TPA: signal peptidase I [Rubrobacteraceae bacterium]|nr:signal peptidase I [Rubrobacteraceae bacterium]